MAVLGPPQKARSVGREHDGALVHVGTRFRPIHPSERMRGASPEGILATATLVVEHLPRAHRAIWIGEVKFPDERTAI
jgi:hypothetical protein